MTVLHFFLVNSPLIYILFSMLLSQPFFYFLKMYFFFSLSFLLLFSFSCSFYLLFTFLLSLIISAPPPLSPSKILFLLSVHLRPYCTIWSAVRLYFWFQNQNKPLYNKLVSIYCRQLISIFSSLIMRCLVSFYFN